MPTAGIMAVLALGAIGFVYGAKPVIKVSKKVGHEVCRVATIGQKCKPHKSFLHKALRQNQRSN